MARIRTIKPEFWVSEQVMECSRLARLLFIGIWNFADDAGRMALSPRTIRAQIFPGDDDVSSDDVLGWIVELSTNDLVLIYEVDGRKYLQVTGWQKHQRIDRPQPSKCPDPKNAEKTGIQEPVRRPIVEHSTSDRAGKEGNGEERKGNGKKTPAHEAPGSAFAAEKFAEFWRLYPHRDGPNPRKPAEQKFSALVRTGLDPDMLIAEVRKFADAEAARGNVGSRFIPQAITWLNQNRWSDHAAVAVINSMGGSHGGTTRKGGSIVDAVKRQLASLDGRSGEDDPAADRGPVLRISHG